jgi:hypothetical protein
MKKKNGLYAIMIIAATAFLSPSCSKDDNGSIPEDDIALAQDEAYVDALFDELDNFALSEIKILDDSDYDIPTTKSTLVDKCYMVSVDHFDTTTFPKEITIDFGEGCSIAFNGDTITRSGQVIITITNRWYLENAQHIMTFNNFYFNGARIEGTRTITNEGLNEKLHLMISVTLQNGKVTFNENSFVTRTASHMNEYAFHLNPLNDTIWVTGTANGTNILGENYNRTILEPLVFVRCPDYQYRWTATEGKIEIINSVRGNMTIEHAGNGCDGDVIIEKDGNRVVYQFRYRDRKNQ